MTDEKLVDKCIDSLFQANSQIARLEAELKVRSGPLPTISSPAIWRGASGAYYSGFERGFRNQSGSNPYSRSDCKAAFADGVYQGHLYATDRIAEMLGSK